MNDLKHVVCVEKVGDCWQYWYVDRTGRKETVRPRCVTLQKALSNAQGYARGIHEGTIAAEYTETDLKRATRPEGLKEIMEAVRKGLSAEDFDVNMRRNLRPEEYRGPPERKVFQSPMETWMAPKSWGYHVDGFPKIIVADDGYPERWLDEADNNDKSRIVKMTIDDAVQEAKKSAAASAKNDANMLWIFFTLAFVAIAITVCRSFN
jgi:hypothetical protein